jgi:hypothetical protein
VAKWLAHLPFTSEAAGSSLSENFLNATRTQSSCEKSKKSTLCRKSWVSSGYSGFLPQGKLTGWVRQKGPTVIGICCCGDPALVGKLKKKKSLDDMAAFLLQAFCDQINHSLFVFHIREKILFFPDKLSSIRYIDLVSSLICTSSLMCIVLNDWPSTVPIKYWISYTSKVNFAYASAIELYVDPSVHFSLCKSEPRLKRSDQ